MSLPIVALFLSNFNSHTREGVTCDDEGLLDDAPDFNSHTREGVTRVKNILSPISSNFNSHTREGVTSAVTFSP